MPTSPEQIDLVLRGTGYLPDAALSTATFLAMQLGTPLLLEGAPGTGKTALATALAEAIGAPLFRLQCYEGLTAEQALYDWDFPRQLMHLRVAESAGRATDLEAELYHRRFLLARPLVQALEASTAEVPAVLLVDEVDRADDEFDAMLLQYLAESAVTIPELGTIRAIRPPVTILTSNRTREVHDALKRRCLYGWLDHPSFERELAIVHSRLPDVSDQLAEQVVIAVDAMRAMELAKIPGVAETLDWVRALHALGVRQLDVGSLTATLGAVVKYREDIEQVVSGGLERLLVARGA